MPPATDTHAAAAATLSLGAQQSSSAAATASQTKLSTNTLTHTHTPETHAALRAHWSSLTINDLLLAAPWKRTARVLAIPATLAAEQAFDILVANGLNAAPIYDAAAASFVGMVSMHDVAAYFVTLLREDPAHIAATMNCVREEEEEKEDEEEQEEKQNEKKDKDKQKNSASYDENNYDDEERRTGCQAPARVVSDIAARIRSRQPVSVTSISDLSHRDPFVSLTASAPLVDVVALFSKGIPRIAVMREGVSAGPTTAESLIAIISQSDLVRYVVELEKSNIVHAVTSKSLSDLGLAQPRELVTVHASDKVIDALMVMQQHELSSVAVVDASRRLIGNISVSDIKLIMCNMRRNHLFETCMQFIAGLKTRKMLSNAGKDDAPVFLAPAGAALLHAMKLMLATHVHRVWITDPTPGSPNYQCPISVISMTDMIRVLS